jgi:hypothetical protein
VFQNRIRENVWKNENTKQKEEDEETKKGGTTVIPY